MAKASGVRRCVQSGAGAFAARTPSNSGHGFALKCLCAYLYWGKPGMISFRNIMLMQMLLGCKWQRRITGECNCRFLGAFNGGLKVALVCEWCRHTIGECKKSAQK